MERRFDAFEPCRWFDRAPRPFRDRAEAAQHLIAAFPTDVGPPVPVAPRSALDRLRVDGVRIICPFPNADLASVGQAYADFGQASEEEEVRLLRAGSIVEKATPT